MKLEDITQIEGKYNMKCNAERIRRIRATLCECSDCIETGLCYKEDVTLCPKSSCDFCDAERELEKYL